MHKNFFLHPQAGQLLAANCGSLALNPGNRKNFFAVPCKISARTSLRLTLFLPTSHMCVENTVLAFMICLLFNLSYKVSIMCKWNQLVYFAIITGNKLNQPPDFHCISPVRFDNKAQNAKFSAKEQHQKLHISIVKF